MTPLSVTRTTLNDFECLIFHTGLIELSILPALGGKINSLRDARTGREWLWRHPLKPYKRVPHGTSYVAAADTGGWDECFPSVAACEYPSAPWQGALIQDHGELWSQVPDFAMEEHEEGLELRTRWQGVALPYTFSRTVTLKANSARLRADYSVRNNASQPMNFVWCIHPLLAIAPGMELRLPPSARFNVGSLIPADLLSQGSILQYPFAAPGLNLSCLPEPSAGIAIKIWSDPLPIDAGWAALCAPDGQLQMRWDVASLPQLAVWMNLGAWSGDAGTPYFNLGLEPCIGAQDSLAEAVTQYNLFANLPPGGDKKWWLEIEVTS